MLKDFINWIQYKIFLHEKGSLPPFKEREIWWCSIGVNVGTEQDGKNDKFNRLVLIIKKFNHRQFWGIPLTTKEPKNKYFYFELKIKNKISYLNLTQMRVFDAQRLNNALDKEYKVPTRVFNQILSRLNDFLKPK